MCQFFCSMWVPSFLSPDRNRVNVVRMIHIADPTITMRGIHTTIVTALDQRISTRFTISGMDLAATADYIRHHLKFAGRSDTLFPTTPSPRSTRPPAATPGR